MIPNRRMLTAFGAGFVVTVVANTVLALTALAPINDDLGIARTKQQGLNFAPLLVGYALLAVFLVWLIPRVHQPNWIRRGVIAGAATGVANSISAHLITTGWSIARPWPMLYSGVIDALATIAGAIVISRTLDQQTSTT